MLKVGITGGIGCGKSEVCRMLEKLGIPIIHADAVAKMLADENELIRRELKQAFGDDIYLIDGGLDRKKVASIIFSDEAAKQRINRIIHPHVLEYQKNALLKLEQSGKVNIAGVEAALIFEAGSEHQFDVIVTVAATRETVMSRLRNRDGLSEHEIQQRMDSQMPIEEKIKRADFVIHNDGPLDELNQKVKRLFNWLNNQER